MNPSSLKNTSYKYLILALCALGNTEVVAQELSLPPIRELVDGNGVDLMSLNFSGKMVPLIDTGPAEASLTYTNGSKSNLDIFLIPPYETGPLPYSAHLVMGGITEVLEGSGTTYTSKSGMGNTLVIDSLTQTYTYTQRDGTVIRFPSKADHYTGRGIPALSILRPDGTLTEFGLKKSIPTSNPSVVYSRIQSVTNNAGYQLKFEYGDTTKIYALNRTESYCDPLADSCSSTTGKPFAETAFAHSPGGSTRTFTDAGGRQATAGDEFYIDYVFRNKSKGSAVNDLIVTAKQYGTGSSGPLYAVASAVNRGATWNYRFVGTTSTQHTVEVKDPLGNYRYITTNLELLQVTQDSDELGRVTTYQYDTYGRRERITYPEGNYTHITYDNRGNITQKLHAAKPGTGLAPIIESAVYPTICSNQKTCNQPTSTTDSRGNTTDYTYDPNHGGVLTVTAPAPYLGAPRPETRYTYTPLYAWYKNSSGVTTQAPTPIYKLSSISSCRTTPSCANTADEVITEFAYQTGSSSEPSNLLLMSVTQRAGDNSVSMGTSFSYDDRGNRIAADGPLAGAADTITTRYDILRRVVGVIGPDPDGAGPLKRRAIRYSYNGDDQPTAIDQGTVEGLSESNWSSFNQLQRSSFTYNSIGLRESASIYSGSSTHSLLQYSYDAAGQLQCIAQRMNPATFPGPLPSACSQTANGPFGPDRITRTTHDAAGQVIRVQTGYDTPSVRDERRTTYTDNGNVQTITDARGNVTTLEYNGHGMLTKTRYPSLSGPSSLTDFEELFYHADGTLHSKRLRDAQIIGFTFDDLGRLQYRNLPGLELDVSYTYDNFGQTTAVAQGGHTLTFGYDALGRLLTQTGPNGTLTSSYDSAGRRTRLTWPDAFYVEYDHLVTGEVAAIRENGATSGAGVLASYAYDNLGRRSSLVRGNGTTTDYAYDSASRLTQLVQDLVATAADQRIDMTHSPAYQISSRSSSNTAYSWAEDQNLSRAYTSNALNQYSSIDGSALSYDPRGNLSNSGMYTYSSENFLISATGGVSLTYDPLGRLHQVSANAETTRFNYDGDRLVAEYNASNQLLRRYVHGAGTDEPLVWYEGSGTSSRRWLHADERGSIISMSNSDGSLFGINSYDEHGVPATSNTGRFQFTGQTWIEEVKLYYFKARFYSASLGRFLQTDPVGYAAGMNLYAYASGDSINRRDPTGLMETVIVEAKRECDFNCQYFVAFEFINNYLNEFEHLTAPLQDAAELTGLDQAKANCSLPSFSKIRNSLPSKSAADQLADGAASYFSDLAWGITAIAAQVGALGPQAQQEATRANSQVSSAGLQMASHPLQTLNSVGAVASKYPLQMGSRALTASAMATAFPVPGLGPALSIFAGYGAAFRTANQHPNAVAVAILVGETCR